MCARWGSKTSRSRGSTGESQKLNKVWANPKDLSLGAFIKRGGKVAKGVCKVAKLATLCSVQLHFSNYRLGHGSNRKCALR